MKNYNTYFIIGFRLLSLMMQAKYSAERLVHRLWSKLSDIGIRQMSTEFLVHPPIVNDVTLDKLFALSVSYSYVYHTDK